MSPKISICIPTYNRSSCLKALLEQICPLIDRETGQGEIEICISDNGSDDGTWPMLQRFDDIYPFLSCRRSEENQGFGRNLWAAAMMAEGDYIYFTGDDDQFQENAIAILRSNVETGADLVLVSSHPTAHLLERGIAPGRIMGLETLEHYIEEVDVFLGSFIGNLMFKREVFQRHCEIGDVVSLSAYPHLFPVFRALRCGEAIFVNRPVTRPDDSARGWRKMQPVYTAVDFARIAKQEICPYVPKTIRRMVMRQLARSIPRALFGVWSGRIQVDRSNPYQNTNPVELLRLYLGHRDFDE